MFDGRFLSLAFVRSCVRQFSLSRKAIKRASVLCVACLLALTRLLASKARGSEERGEEASGLCLLPAAQQTNKVGREEKQFEW